MKNPPNRGGKGPKTTSQGKKGPISGNRASTTGPARPWHLGQGSSKSMNFGKNVKKS